MAERIVINPNGSFLIVGGKNKMKKINYPKCSFCGDAIKKGNQKDKNNNPIHQLCKNMDD